MVAKHDQAMRGADGNLRKVVGLLRAVRERRGSTTAATLTVARSLDDWCPGQVLGMVMVAVNMLADDDTYKTEQVGDSTAQE